MEAGKEGPGGGSAPEGAASSLYRWLTGLPFAASLLTALLLVTALGTFIPQGSGREGLISSLGLDDIFHSLLFRGLLATLAFCMALVIIRRRAWRFPEWGPFLAHGGVAVILCGSLVGSLWGAKGFIELKEGQAARSMQVQDAFGRLTGAETGLGFDLRLDHVEMERYPLEYRVYYYRQKGEKWKALSSIGVKDTGQWIGAGGAGRGFRLVRAYPDFDVRMDLQERPEGKGVPALQLRLIDKEGQGRAATLLAGLKDREEIRPDKGLSVRFVWNDEPPRWSEARPEGHRVHVELSGGSPPLDLTVKPGGTYSLGPGGPELTVLEYFPDFVYDSKERRGASRSDQPRNPALRVSLRDAKSGRVEERWLFANNPDFSRGHGGGQEGPDLRYRYEPAYEPAEREIVVAGKTREVVEYRRGSLQGRRALVLGGGNDLAPGVEAERLLPSAEEVAVHITRSSEWLRPVAEIEVREEGKTSRAFLLADEPARFGPEGNVLIFEKKADEARAYRSRVSILKGGAETRRGTILVNHPLAHRGFQFYQSKYDDKVPSAPVSGFLVVKDPGLGIVYAGFVMVSLGVILSFYVRPRLKRAAGGGAPP